MGRENDVMGYKGEVTPINVRQHSVTYLNLLISKSLCV